jgi:mannose-6-phosphate isomerase
MKQMKTQMEIFEQVEKLLSNLNFTIVQEDRGRPWGGFFVIDESQAPQFAQYFFPDESIDQLKISEKLSPKILMVAPGKRLSWQYHHRRAEIWKCIDGQVAVATSETDTESAQHILQVNDIIKLKQGERHRLIGLEGWGVIAEIWQHTNADHPSDEDDIVRVQDDFGR